MQLEDALSKERELIDFPRDQEMIRQIELKKRDEASKQQETKERILMKKEEDFMRALIRVEKETKERLIKE